MAEKSNFGDLIKQLESSPSSIKKPREKLRPGVPSVSAVQMTDERGQLIKRESWAPKSGVLKASERKNKIPLAISSGWPTRPTGVTSLRPLLISGS